MRRGRKRKDEYNNLHGSQRGSEYNAPADRDEAYKILAAEIVKVAAADYIQYILKPNFEDEVETAAYHYRRSKAICKKLEVFGEEYKTEAFQYLKKCVDESAETGLFSLGHDSRMSNLLVRLKEEPKTMFLLRKHASDYMMANKVAYIAAKKRDTTRKERKKVCEEFFASEDFALFTGGLIEPQDLIAECERRARTGEVNIYAEYDTSEL